MRLSNYQPILGPAGFAVLHYLAARDESSTRQLVAGVKAAASYGWRLHLINDLVQAGYIRRANPGGKGVAALYALTAAGRSLVAADSMEKRNSAKPNSFSRAAKQRKGEGCQVK